MPKRKILLNPGPATTSEGVKYSQIVSDICPREKEFTEVMNDVRNGLVKISGGGDDYACVLFGGSGTAAMDSVINSVVHNKKILIINNGAYGDRFIKIAKTYKINFVELKFDLDKEIEIEKIEQKLSEDKEIGFVAVVHHETTTGILNPIKEIGELCEKNNCTFIVDNISSFAGIPFSVIDCKIDFMMSTSNKCIHGMPGVCFVIAKKTAIENLKHNEKRSFYLDLYNQYVSFENTGQTSFTPPVQSIYALKEAINEFFREGGINKRYEKYSNNYAILIEGLKKLGFEPMHNERIHSKISTTFLEPKNMNLNLNELHDKLYERGFTIYPNIVGGKKSIRFANMGDLNTNDIELFLINLEEVLNEINLQDKENETKETTAIILAAGMGTRLQEVCNGKPKPLFEICGQSLIEHSLEALSQSGINKVNIVVGFKGEMIKEKLGNKFKNIEIEYSENKNYLTTGSMHSLYCAINQPEDFLILDADLVFDPKIISKMLESGKKDTLFLTPCCGSGEETYVILDSEERILYLSLINKIDKNLIEGKKICEFNGISRYSKEFIQELLKVHKQNIEQNKLSEYYEETAFEVGKKIPLHGVINEERLLLSEIDRKEDIPRAEEVIKNLNKKENIKFKKILLINPSNTIAKDSVRRLTTPLGLLYVGASLKKEGYEVKIIDSPCEGYENTISNKSGYITYGLPDEDLKERIREYKPDIVGITSMFTAQQKNVEYHCDLVKSIDQNIPLVLGGVHPSLDPINSVKNASVDYVIIGEGEYRFLDLLAALEKNEEPNFDGVAYKINREVKFKPKIHRIENLNALPQPARDLIDMEKYIEIGVPYAPFSKRERVEQIATSRGCPFNCNFCATSAYWDHKFKMRSVNNIFEEIDELVNKYKIEEIQFADDNLTLDKERAKEIFRRLANYNLSWCSPSGLMAQTLDKEMIGLMAKSGAYQLTFSIESGSHRVLKDIIQKIIPEKEEIKELIDECHKYGIQTHGMFIIGFPGETREEMEMTLNYPKEVGFDSVSFFVASPMFGSRLYNECKEKGYIDESKMMWDVKSAEINIPENSPDYVMYKLDLEKLVDERVRDFNEFSKIKNPGAWDKKFQQFLKRHGDKADLILGRVT